MPDKKDIVVFDRKSAERIADVVRNSGIGDGGGGIPEETRGPAWRTFWAKIGTAHYLATNRWEYDWVEQWRVAGVWADKPRGRSSTETTRALNSVESFNDGSGVEGNSINIDNLGDGFDLQPVQGEPVVRMRVDFYKDGERWKIAYSFSYENAVDGECATTPGGVRYGTNLTLIDGSGGDTYSMVAEDQTVVNTATIPIDVVLIQAIDMPGEIKTVKNSGTEDMTVTPYSGDSIDGSTDPFDLIPGECLDLQCVTDGEWTVI